MRRFRNKSSNLPPIPHEHDLFLVALEIIENSTEVAGYVGYGQRLHHDQINRTRTTTAVGLEPTGR